jgi:hypothetical protein
MFQFRHQGGVVEHSGQAVAMYQLPNPSAPLRARQHDLQQVPPFDRLGEEVIAAGPQSLHFVSERAARRQEDNRHQGEARVLAHQAGDGVSVHVRQVDIEEHQVGEFAGQCFRR